MPWEDASALVRRANEEAWEELPAAEPIEERDLLRGLSPEANERLWQVLEERARHPGKRPYRRRIPLEGPQAQPGSARAEVEAMLRADPHISYADVARAVGTSYSNVCSVACRAGLRRKTGDRRRVA